MSSHQNNRGNHENNTKNANNPNNHGKGRFIASFGKATPKRTTSIFDPATTPGHGQSSQSKNRPTPSIARSLGFGDDDDIDLDQGHGHGQRQPVDKQTVDPSHESTRRGVMRPGTRGGHSGAGPARRHFGTSSMTMPSLSQLTTARDEEPMDHDSPGPKYFSSGHEQPPVSERGRQDDDTGDRLSANIPPPIRKRDPALEPTVSRPTLRLSQLPPDTSISLVKSLVPAHLVIEDIKISAQHNSSGLARRQAMAIVSFSPETPAAELDAAVNLLQNRYLGFGYYLSLQRYLSSTVALSTVLYTSQQPFHAKPIAHLPTDAKPTDRDPRRGNPSFAPPSFAPPPSSSNLSSSLPNRHYQPSRPDYESSRRNHEYYVPVRPPSDLRMIRAIHKVIELVLEQGPEVEAVLMTRPEVQRDEKWAWLWDARSEGGIWYRWRLWELTVGQVKNHPSQKPPKLVPFFRDLPIVWKAPEEKSLPFEFVTRFDDLALHPDYREENDDHEDIDLDNPSTWSRSETRDSTFSEEKSFLNPLQKARFTHLLARLPPTSLHLKKGDIARVTAFAMSRASEGASEIVDMLVQNVLHPFCLSVFPDVPVDDDDNNNDVRPESNRPLHPTRRPRNDQDPSAAQLVGLDVIHDVLASAATSGLRHAWRYRGGLEASLRANRVFARLAALPERLGWGRMRAEKWRQSILYVLNLWEGWSVFDPSTQSHFVRSFQPGEEGKKGREEIVVEKTVKEDKEWSAVPARGHHDDNASVASRTTEVPRGASQAMEKYDATSDAWQGEDATGEAITDEDLRVEEMWGEDAEGEPIDDAYLEALDRGLHLLDSDPQSPVEQTHSPSSGLGLQDHQDHTVLPQDTRPVRQDVQQDQDRQDHPSEKSLPNAEPPPSDDNNASHTKRRPRMKAVDLFG